MKKIFSRLPKNTKAAEKSVKTANEGSGKLWSKSALGGFIKAEIESGKLFTTFDIKKIFL